jgi:pSer/pThr/pTyr-binding forkhead associated (FHA) protein
VVRVLNRGRSPFRLRLHDGEIRLRVGEHVAGRGASCDIVLDDSQVSRQHARFEVTDEQVVLIDLGSINGSFVNRRRVRDRCELRPGDRIKLGNSKLELLVGQEPTEDRTRDTLEDIEPPPATVLGEEDIPTRRADGLEVGATGAEMAYAAGQPLQAERFLGGYLASVLTELEAGRPLPDPTVLEALRLSLRLAAKTEKGAWVDYGVKLLAAHDALPPEEQLAEMRDLVQRLAIDSALLESYGAKMSAGVATLTASERGTLERLQELCRSVGAADHPDPGGGLPK